MRNAEAGDLGPMGELIARSVTNNLYRFVIPAVAGPARLVPLASLADKKSDPPTRCAWPPSAVASVPKNQDKEPG